MPGAFGLASGRSSDFAGLAGTSSGKPWGPTGAEIASAEPRRPAAESRPSALSPRRDIELWAKLWADLVELKVDVNG